MRCGTAPQEGWLGLDSRWGIWKNSSIYNSINYKLLELLKLLKLATHNRFGEINPWWWPTLRALANYENISVDFLIIKPTRRTNFSDLFSE